MSTEIQHEAFKTAFAEALLRNPDEPYKAAYAAIPDVGLACQAAAQWVNDPFVKAEKIRLLAERGLKSFLPDKEKQAKDIYDIAQDQQLDPDVRLKAHRLYAEVMNHIDKPTSSTTNVNVLSQQVMIVKDHGSDIEWEHSAETQQQGLIYGASASN